jgi:hypothetical protein
VTDTLGIQPTKSHEAGEARSKRDAGPWANAMWSLESDLAWEQPLGDHLSRLCEAVASRREELVVLTREGYLMDMFCFVEVQNGPGGVLLEPDVLKQLADLPVELDLDIYASGDEAELVASERAR